MKSFTNYDYDKDQLRNKYNQLKTTQNDFKKLLNETGVGFDSTTGRLVMDDDRWNKLSKVIPKVKRFKKKGCKHYDRLCLIFDGITATGSKAHLSTKSTKSPSDSDENDNPLPKKEVKRERSQLFKMPRHRVKEDSFALIMDKVMNRFEEQSKRRWEEFQNVGVFSTTQKSMHATDCLSSSRSSKVDRMHLVKECISALQVIEGIEDAQMAKTLDRVFENVAWREFFLKIPEEMRKVWVMNM